MIERTELVKSPLNPSALILTEPMGVRTVELLRFKMVEKLSKFRLTVPLIIGTV